MRGLVIAVVLASASVATAADGEPQVSASLSADEVTLGDAVTLSILAVHPAELTVTLPSSLPLGAELTERDRSQQRRDNGDGTVTTEFRVEIVAYELGDVEVPPIPVSYLRGGAAHRVETQPLALHVASYIGDDQLGDAGLRPAAAPVTVLHRDWSLVWAGAFLLGAALAALVTWGVLRWLRGRRRGPEPAVVAAAARSAPHEEALARLAELEASGALDADDLAPAYVRLSEVVRAYVGRRYGFGELDLTTDEIHEAFRRRPELFGDVGAEVVAWLQDCDLVKFAAAAASPDDARQSLYWARKLVQRTTPVPVARVPAVPPGGAARA